VWTVLVQTYRRELWPVSDGRRNDSARRHRFVAEAVARD
jgi:hypothetical protein